MNYAEQQHALKLNCDTDIALIPEVTARKLAFYTESRDLALANDDRHMANNWQHSIVMAEHLRDMRA